MKKILIVEDDEKSLYLARFILKKEGYEVIEARDGLEALDKVSKETPDLILMDMQLPKLDGYEATKAIRNLECARPPRLSARDGGQGLRNKIEEGPYSKSEIPGPDLADQDDVMVKEVWEASKSKGISKSTRDRAGRNLKSKIQNIPIIALTAYAMKGDREKTLEAGCTGYIEKPINPETIISEIQKVVGVDNADA